MSCKTVQVGDTGTTFEATVLDGVDPVDLTGATTLDILMSPPVGALKTFAGSLTTDGTDGKLEYVTAATSDLDESGVWSWQPYVVLPTGEWHGDTQTFTVEANLS